jgi:gamma-butyrobetaine dioxygenase
MRQVLKQRSVMTATQHDEAIMSENCEVLSLETLADRRLALTWGDGEVSRFHFVWLRQQFFHPAIGRLDQTERDSLRLPDEPGDLVVAECGIEGDCLVVSWANDGAVTRHDLVWLRRNAYDREQRLARKAKQQTWTGDETTGAEWLEWEQVIQDEAALYGLFLRLRDKGVARLRGAPTRKEEVRRLADRFGALRNTDFGLIGEIVSKPPDEAGRYANIGSGSAGPLAAHTDEGWRYAPPGINFHLAIENTPGSGGESMLFDGLLAAERLRLNNPEAFAFLTSTPMRFAAERNPQERYYSHGRMIVTDRDGDVVGVRFSDRTLGVQDLDEDQIEPAYRALRAFAIEMYADDLVYRHKLQSGECHVFDNHRVLHARCGFDPSSGPRYIQQCSVDREEFHNTYRQLAEKLGHMDDAKMILPNGALG